MRRFVTLVFLLLFTIPFGLSISGCSKKNTVTFCDGGDSGLVVGQTTTITLLPKVYGISLNYAEIGQVNTPSATDCKGNASSISAYTYGTTDMTIADVQPTSGRVCAGTWNRNTGGGIADYTVCNPTSKSGTAYISASASGVTSNPLPIFVHPVVTSVVLGSPTTNCTTDPTTQCCPLATVGAIVATPYAANSCLSQGATGQLVARVFSGTGTAQTNISCLTGHLSYTAQNASIVTVDPNGVATATLPGSTLITANVSNASSSAGFFSTCPPVSITLTAPGVAGTLNPVVVNQNNTQPLVATAVDANGVTLTGLTLEYISTSPATIPAASTVIPSYAGAASISALCQPPACNPSSYNQIGLFGNGKPVSSNALNLSSPGINSTILYMASTGSQYVVPMDFTTTSLGAPFRLPFVPNSMVITVDGSTIFMGSSTELMVLSAVSTLTLAREDLTSSGTVLSVSPDGSTVVISDPVRQIITLEASTGAVITTFGGVGTHAQWTPDSQMVYITAGNQILVYSNNTGWNSITPPTPTGQPATDVAVTVPGVGAYFAGASTTARGYCSASTPTTASGITTETNVFYPLADTSPAVIDRIASTSDGLHILGASITPTPTLSDLQVTIPSSNTRRASVPITCPTTGGLVFSNVLSTTILNPVTATAITGVFPTSDSTLAFVTYTGSGGVLPAYAPVASGPGTTSYIKLSGTATAPVFGTLSSDNSVFYVGTSGDNLVHLITRSPLTDSKTLAPNLPGTSGGIATPNLIVERPRKTT